MSQHVVHEAVRPRVRVSTQSVVSPHALSRRPRVPAHGRLSLPIRNVSPRRPLAAPPAALLATVALLHIPLVGIAFLHAQSPRSAQYRHSNGTGVQ